MTYNERRKKKGQRKGNPTVAIIVDGHTEKWYIEKVKKYYLPGKPISIEPKLPSQKKVDDLFKLAEDLAKKEKDKILVIIDLDTVSNNDKEWQKFSQLYQKYKRVKTEQTAQNSWMKKIEVLINNPCLEYWYLLHFINTTVFHTNYNGLEKELKRDNRLPTYDKSGDYYNSSPDIYKRLEKKLQIARDNARDFDIDTCKEVGCSEMNKLFDCLDQI